MSFYDLDAEASLHGVQSATRDQEDEGDLASLDTDYDRELDEDNINYNLDFERFRKRGDGSSGG